MRFPKTNYVAAPAKTLIRELLLSLPYEEQRGRVLSFGGPYGTDLGMFARNGHQVVSLEREPDVFAFQRSHIIHPSITIRRDSVEEYAAWWDRNGTAEEPFTLAFLDFCGPYTTRREKATSLLLKNRLIAPEGFLAVTYTEARETPADMRRSKALQLAKTWDNLLDNRFEFFRRATQSLAPNSVHLDKWSTVRYLNDEGHMAMMFMCCQVHYEE